MKDKLTVKDICKKYKTRDGYIDVLENLNFTLSKGESLSIVGESGAGKSTLLNILALLLKPDSGEIIFEGTNILQLRDKSKLAAWTSGNRESILEGLYLEYRKNYKKTSFHQGIPVDFWDVPRLAFIFSFMQ